MGYFYEDDDNDSWSRDTGAGTNHGPSVPAATGAPAPAAKNEKKKPSWARKLAAIGAGIGGSMLGGPGVGFKLMDIITGQSEDEEERRRERDYERRWDRGRTNG